MINVDVADWASPISVSGLGHGLIFDFLLSAALNILCPMSLATMTVNWNDYELNDILNTFCTNTAKVSLQ